MQTFHSVTENVSFVCFLGIKCKRCFRMKFMNLIVVSMRIWRPHWLRMELNENVGRMVYFWAFQKVGKKKLRASSDGHDKQRMLHAIGVMEMVFVTNNDCGKTSRRNNRKCVCTVLSLCPLIAYIGSKCAMCSISNWHVSEVSSYCWSLDWLHCCADVCIES